MVIRRIITAAGVIALLVGIVGLLAPVSVDPERQVVGCGSVIMPDLSAAQARDDDDPANRLHAGELVADPNYTRLCRMELEDRRLGTSTLVALGVLTITGAAGYAVWSRRRRLDSSTV